MNAAASHTWERTSTRRKRIFVYLLIFVVTTLLVLHVAAQMYILSLGKEIRSIRAERAGIDAETVNLELMAADLRTGSRIKMIARDNLGMIVPDGAPQKLF